MRSAGGSIARSATHLQQVVLDDVADGAGLLVELARAPCTPKLSAIVIWTLST